jgi:hypothetical protein
VSTTFAISAASAGVTSAARGCSSKRAHRAGNIGGAPDRRQRELYRAVTAWPQDALQAQPQRRCVAAEGEFDGLAGQRLGLAVEHDRSGFGRPVGRPAWPAGGVARPALFEGPPSARCFRCYLQRHISHGYLLLA